MKAETYSLQIRKGGTQKGSCPKAPQGPIPFHQHFLTALLTLRNGIFPVTSVNKDVIVISNYSPPSLSWALRALRKKNTCHVAATRLQSLPTVSPKGAHDVKDIGYWPHSWDACERSDFREPRLLHIPTHRKVLKPLTWDVWFSLTNDDLLMFRLPVLCCKASILPGSSLEQFCQGYLRCCLLGLKS